MDEWVDVYAECPPDPVINSFKRFTNLTLSYKVVMNDRLESHFVRYEALVKGCLRSINGTEELLLDCSVVYTSSGYFLFQLALCFIYFSDIAHNFLCILFKYI